MSFFLRHYVLREALVFVHLRVYKEDFQCRGTRKALQGCAPGLRDMLFTKEKENADVLRYFAELGFIDACRASCEACLHSR